MASRHVTINLRYPNRRRIQVDTRGFIPADFGLVTMATTSGLLLTNFGLNGFPEAVVQWEGLGMPLRHLRPRNRPIRQRLDLGAALPRIKRGPGGHQGLQDALGHPAAPRPGAGRAPKPRPLWPPRPGPTRCGGEMSSRSLGSIPPGLTQGDVMDVQRSRNGVLQRELPSRWKAEALGNTHASS